MYMYVVIHKFFFCPNDYSLLAAQLPVEVPPLAEHSSDVKHVPGEMFDMFTCIHKKYIASLPEVYMLLMLSTLTTLSEQQQQCCVSLNLKYNL